VEDPVEKDALLKKLIGEHEPAYAAQWRSLGEDYQQKMLSGIVGFELTVSEVQCKLKLNQHRPEATETTKALYARGGENEQSLVRWMERLGMTGKPPSQI
jgi:transcriptional regulator